jgi:predicted ribosome quality control (RQC) complex YloA/Tae2 family protein
MNNTTTDVNNATGTGKFFLLLESGIRFHTLQHYSAESPMPTPFAAKLRKHLRSLRLEQVQQIGSDRVVLLQFGSGLPNRHAIILELYAKGNIILVDAEYKILAPLRSYVYERGGVDEGKGSAIAVQVDKCIRRTRRVGRSKDGG